MSVSFGFSKCIAKKSLVKPDETTFDDDVSEAHDDRLKDIDKKATIISWDDNSENKTGNNKDDQLIIPLIRENQWQKPQSDAVNNGVILELDKDTEAKQALLREALNLKEDKHEFGDAKTIPLLYANRVPDGFETDEKLDTVLRPEEPNLSDYDAVPIESFGLAVLRGMGWSQGAPIGKSHKMAVAPKIPELRPKGLGLGADRRLAANLKVGKRNEKDNKGEEGKVLKIGGFVKIVRGPHRETFGKVESLDEDNARIIVRLALGGTIVTVSQYGIVLVTQKEYERDSKCINKSQYEKYKDKVGSLKDVEDEKVDDQTSSPYPQQSSEKKRRKSRSPSFKSKKKRETKNEEERAEACPWIRPDLRVRIIDKKYKQGKYYKEKVTTVDAAASDECICRDDKGRILEALKQEMLETVIPKSETAYVMILRGKYRGEIGNIVKKDGKQCKAVVQLLRYQSLLEIFGFDDICEYLGDISAYE